jgi:hypothetical protein
LEWGKDTIAIFATSPLATTSKVERDTFKACRIRDKEELTMSVLKVCEFS